MSFGTIIPGLQIDGVDAPYPVFNERAIRATAGSMMLVGFITFVVVYTTKNYLYLYPTVGLFWLQFAISILWGTKYAPFSALGTLLVSKQKPEYV